MKIGDLCVLSYKSDMVWTCIFLTYWMVAGQGAATQGGCFIESERRQENGCHRKITCAGYFSPVSNFSRCNVHSGTYGTDLSLYNFTETSVKSTVPETIRDHYIEKINAAYNNWIIIRKHDFLFCKNARFLNLSHNLIQILHDGSFSSLNKLETLDLSYNNIYRVDRKHFSLNVAKSAPPLKTLLLAHNHISIVKNDAFADLHTLELLDLSYNKIMEFHPGSLRNLNFLQKLKLENNRLKTFANFKDLINLRHINISNNELTHIYINTFIMTLDASHNNVRDIDLNMFNRSFIPTIDMSHNSLKELRNTTMKHYRANGRYYGLMKLDFSFNNINYIQPNAFVAFYNVVMLDLSYNKLINLEINNTYLRHLTELRLQYNHFNFIDSRMFLGLNNLKYLDISNNELSASALHQHSFAFLNKLTTLKMCNNDIKVITEMNGLDGLLNLVELDMFNNSLHTVNFTGARCFKLSKLSLRQNKIWNIKNVELYQLPEIHEVDISNNYIEEIDQNSFLKLHSLKYLNLSSNKIANIFPAAFLDLNQLKSLDLSNNIVESIQYGSFQGLGHLQLLDLSSNQLRYVKMNAFLQLNSLEMLILDNNNIVSIDHTSYRIAGGGLSVSIGGNKLSCDWTTAAVSNQLPGHPLITFQSKIKDYLSRNFDGIRCEDNEPNVEIVGKTILTDSRASSYTEGEHIKTDEIMVNAIRKQNDYLQNIERYVKNIMEMIGYKDGINNVNTYDDFSQEDFLDKPIK